MWAGKIRPASQPADPVGPGQDGPDGGGYAGAAGPFRRRAGPRRAGAALTDAERKVLACAGGEAVSLEELAARCGMQAAALAPVLMRLELSGRVKMLPGQRYIFL